jgi:gliding motility-associated-like protein
LQSTALPVTDASCFGTSDGSGSISVIGGNNNTPYTYVWDSNSSVTNSISSVSAGEYFCTITDVNGCEDTISISVGEPTVVVLEVVNVDSNLCFGDTNGVITVIASGGTPPYLDYTIESTNITQSQDSSIFTNLITDYYDLWVYDFNSCQSSILLYQDSIIHIVKLGDPGHIQLEAYSEDLTCFESKDGLIEYAINGGKAPYHYQLLSDNDTVTVGVVYEGPDTLKVNYLVEGTYNLYLTDYNECEDNIEVSISQPNQVVADFTISEDLILKNDRVDVVNLSSGANTYLWYFGDGTANVEVVEIDHKYTNQGTYEIVLVASYSTLSELCKDTAYASIDVEGYNITNVFTPNGDGVNDVFQFTDEMLVTLNVSIFNRWGQQVFGFENVNGIWDGKGYNGELLPEGVYFFTMEATGSLGDSYIEEGTITIIK